MQVGLSKINLIFSKCYLYIRPLSIDMTLRKLPAGLFTGNIYIFHSDDDLCKNPHHGHINGTTINVCQGVILSKMNYFSDS